MGLREKAMGGKVRAVISSVRDVKNMYLDKRRFRQAMREVRNVVLVIAAVVWFCVFIYQHSGIGYGERVVSDVVTYEFVTQTSAEDSRVKKVVPQKVIYRYVGK